MSSAQESPDECFSADFALLGHSHVPQQWCSMAVVAVGIVDVDPWQLNRLHGLAELELVASQDAENLTWL